MSVCFCRGNDSVGEAVLVAGEALGSAVETVLVSVEVVGSAVVIVLDLV